jgi:hypothetical protein
VTEPNMYRAEFVGSLPDIQSAICGGQDGLRIKLDIPEQYKGEGVKLHTMFGKPLRITIVVEG